VALLLIYLLKIKLKIAPGIVGKTTLLLFFASNSRIEPSKWCGPFRYETFITAFFQLLKNMFSQFKLPKSDSSLLKHCNSAYFLRIVKEV